MTDTSKMPARIHAGGDPSRGIWSQWSHVDTTLYYRADIVEAMAEALERAEELYQVGLLKAKDGLADQVVALRRTALTAYREATNDKA